MAEAKKVESIPKVNKKKEVTADINDNSIDKFFHQNSPINNEMVRNEVLNELYPQEVDGQSQIVPTEVTVKKSKGKSAAVRTLCSFSYDDNVDIEKLNKSGRFRITGYDRRVYNAVGTLWLSGKKKMTLTEIFAIMNGYAKANPAEVQLQKIENSLYKLSSIVAYIDFTEEVKKNTLKNKDALVEAGILKNNTDEIKKAVIKDNMLHFSVGIIESEQGKVYRNFNIIGTPCVLAYNIAKNSIISIPIEYIGLRNTSATEKSISFQDYLLMRIINYKQGKMEQNIIKYDTLYRDSGVKLPTKPDSRSSDRKLVETIMDEFVEKGLLIGYEKIKKGRTPVGIKFYVSNDEELESEDIAEITAENIDE